MSPFAPFTEEQFQYMAMGKARAYTWESLAQQINMPLEIVERVAWTHEKQWNRFLTKAERHIARETITELATVLRADLRNTEPQHHATLVNSLSRVLKLQQDFAPKRRRTTNTMPLTPPVVPVPTPATPETPTHRPLPSLNGTLASLLGFFLLLGALLMGCWNRAAGTPERPDSVAYEPTACIVVASSCTSDFSLTGLHASVGNVFSSG